MVGIVSLWPYTIVCLVMLVCTYGVNNLLYYCRHSARDRQCKCSPNSIKKNEKYILKCVIKYGNGGARDKVTS